MKILESQSAVLSNSEVLVHIQTARAQPRSIPQKHPNVETILKEITDYLHPPPTSRNPIPAYNAPGYTAATIRELVELLQPYELTKGETLMIINLRPLDLTLLDCVVEECDERFTPERQEEILKIIGDVLGREHRAEGVNGTNGLSNGNSANGSGEMEK